MSQVPIESVILSVKADTGDLKDTIKTIKDFKKLLGTIKNPLGANVKGLKDIITKAFEDADMKVDVSKDLKNHLKIMAKMLAEHGNMINLSLLQFSGRKLEGLTPHSMFVSGIRKMGGGDYFATINAIKNSPEFKATIAKMLAGKKITPESLGNDEKAYEAAVKFEEARVIQGMINYMLSGTMLKLPIKSVSRINEVLATRKDWSISGFASNLTLMKQFAALPERIKESVYEGLLAGRFEAMGIPTSRQIRFSRISEERKEQPTGKLATYKDVLEYLGFKGGKIPTSLLLLPEKLKVLEKYVKEIPIPGMKGTINVSKIVEAFKDDESKYKEFRNLYKEYVTKVSSKQSTIASAITDMILTMQISGKKKPEEILGELYGKIGGTIVGKSGDLSKLLATSGGKTIASFMELKTMEGTSTSVIKQEIMKRYLSGFPIAVAAPGLKDIAEEVENELSSIKDLSYVLIDLKQDYEKDFMEKYTNMVTMEKEILEKGGLDKIIEMAIKNSGYVTRADFERFKNYFNKFFTTFTSLQTMPGVSNDILKKLEEIKDSMEKKMEGDVV